MKSAKYVDKCNPLSQEFYFSHPVTKVNINGIYYCHFTGSQLWGLNSREFGKLESTYNKSIKLMFNLHLQTHRYLIEPLTEQPHLRKLLFKRYLTFISSIQKSKKKPLRTLLELSKGDASTTTGRNLRLLMMMCGKHSVDELQVDDIDTMEYHCIPRSEAWRVGMLKELVDIRENETEVPCMTYEELTEIMNFICTA